jgi:copper transport protein
MLRRSIAATLLAGLSTLAFAGRADAHASLASSDPASGAMLDSAPATVTLKFTEPPDPRLSIVHVLDVNGTPVESGPAEAVPGPDDQLRIGLPADLPDGVYTVSWRVVSEADGHSSAGAFSFGVGLPPGSAIEPSVPVPATPQPSLASVAGRAALYAGLALLFASAVVGLRAFGGTVPARRRVLRIGAALAVLGAVTMLLAEAATLGVALGDLLSSNTGRDFIWLSVAVGAAAVAALIAGRRSDRVSLAVVGVAAAAAMLVRAMGGHAAAAATPAPQITLQWVHFMAIGVWMGGIGLALLLIRTDRSNDALGQQVRRFSRLAGYALAAVLVTGMLRAMKEMGGLSAFFHLFRTSYGTTLAIKIGVVALLIALGAFNRYRSIPRMQDRPGLIRRVMAIELAGALGVFALTGTLTGLPPQPPPAMSPAPTSHIILSGSDFATTLNVRLVVTPGTAGLNGFEVRVTDFDSGAPLDADDVSLRFEPVGQPGVGASMLDLVRDGERWQATGTQLSLEGVWGITVKVQTSSAGTEIPLTLITPVDQTVSVATAVGQPDLYTITLPGDRQIQAYNDPGAPGPNQLHLTAFDATGNELPLEGVDMIVIEPDGSATSLQPRRFSPGHFVADVTLSSGDRTFFLRATARDGTVLVASFEQSI